MPVANTQPTTAWPAGVIARYLTVGGATVDITHGTDPDLTLAVCGGCQQQDVERWRVHAGRYDSGSEGALTDARRWAQSHAATCRAMPRPA